MSAARHLQETLDLSEVEPDKTPVELRCSGGALHGKLLPNGLLEIKCHFKPCTQGTQVVFHYYDPLTGALVDTKKWNDPAPKMKGRRR